MLLAFHRKVELDIGGRIVGEEGTGGMLRAIRSSCGRNEGALAAVPVRLALRNGSGNLIEQSICAGATSMAHNFTLTVDGKTHAISIDDPDMPLLYALRDELGLNNPRFGCGLAQCGACTVHLDGHAVRSCVTPVSSVGDQKITTLAGLGAPERPHPIQTAWIEEQVNQCGYCINGWIMTGAELLARNPRPGDREIREAFADLICRCGTHNAAVKAVKRASGQA